jgi:putative glutamine amidotransferase
MSRLPLIGNRACNPQGAHLANHVYGRAHFSSALMAGVGLSQILPAPEHRLPRLARASFIDSPFIAEPIHYSPQASRPATICNRLHSLATLPFIRAAVASGGPVSPIGRPFAQANAVFAGHERRCAHETRRYTSTVFAA